MMLANLRHETVDSVVIAEITGEIDMSNTNELRMALSNMTSNDALGLIVDMSELEYIDSAGITSSTVCARACEAVDNSFAWSSPATRSSIRP